tara:strand:- start:174 stop:956 length:783 start_codon:yes stop_codon:yes gene_type:complete
MKHLKTLFSLVALLVFGVETQAQECGITHSSNVVTQEAPQYQTNFTVSSWVKHQDSVQLIGIPSLDSNTWFTLASFTQPDTSLWYDGDSLNFIFTLQADTNALSFYAQKLTFSQSIILQNGNKEVIQWNAWVYFTPWRTIEIWNEQDYYGGTRSWKIAHPDSAEPMRVYFSKSMLPTSTYQMPDTSAEEWEYEHLSEDVSEAPFFIKHAAIHPDTMEAYCHAYGDSAWYHYQQGHPASSNSSAKQKFGGKRFDGSVTIRT